MGGGSSDAANEANRMEQTRQQNIRITQRRINQVFNDPQRSADIANFVGATRQYYQQDLDRQKADADRGLIFALAKSGLSGGSTQVDQQQRLGDNYAKGLLQVEQKAQGAGGALEAADQDARQRLIGLATSGLDSTTGAAQAAAMMKSNLENQQASLGALSDAFTGVNNFVQQAKDAQQRRQGYYSTFGGQRSALYGGGSNANNNGFGGY